MYKNIVLSEIEKIFLDNKNSHSYIFHTNNFDFCKQDVYGLVKKIFNVDNLNLISSDFFVVSKTDKKNILKDDISDLRNFFQNTSYLNKKRLYLIEEVHKLNTTSANMILKFLEEPLNGVIAFFITTNLDSVLTTIKSRCQVINCFYEEENMLNENFIKIVDDIFTKNKYINIFTLKKILDQYQRDSLINMFNNYLSFCYSNFKMDYRERIFVINNAINMLNNNVNIDYVFDYICVEGGNNK